MKIKITGINKDNECLFTYALKSGGYYGYDNRLSDCESELVLTDQEYLNEKIDILKTIDQLIAFNIPFYLEY